MKRKMTGPVPSLASVAIGIRQSADRHESLRRVAAFIARFDATPAPERPGMVAEEPPSTGDLRWDALLAATAEHVCYHHGIPVPAWTAAPGRFLAEWWFVSPYRSLHASALVDTPAAFANRGVFLHAGSLASI